MLGLFKQYHTVSVLNHKILESDVGGMEWITYKTKDKKCKFIDFMWQ